MPARLKENWIILVDPGCSYLINLAYPKPTWWYLDRSHLLILSSLDGATSKNAVSSKLSTTAHINRREAAELFDKTLDRYRHCLDVHPGKKKRRTPHIFHSKDTHPLTKKQKIRNCAPLRLSWVATTTCPKRCRYCYMDAQPWQASDKLAISLKSLGKIADEAVQLAMPEFVITGGEPFALKDIYPTINLLLKHHISVKVATKAFVDCSRLLKTAGRFLDVEQSLDSTDDALVADLTGRRHAFEEAMASMKEMKQHHIPFRVKMVVGRTNAGSVSRMAALCQKLGADTLQVTEYRKSFKRNIRGFALNKNLRTKLIRDINRISKSLRLPIETDLARPEKHHHPLQGAYCGEGIKSLSLLPDGTATRCPALSDDHHLACGNILRRGIYGIWNEDKRYGSLVSPSRLRYKKTRCYHCRQLKDCNSSGRCLMKTLQGNGKYFGPDRDCSPTPQNTGCFT